MEWIFRGKNFPENCHACYIRSQSVPIFLPLLLLLLLFLFRWKASALCLKLCVWKQSWRVIPARWCSHDVCRVLLISLCISRAVREYTSAFWSYMASTSTFLGVFQWFLCQCKWWVRNELSYFGFLESLSTIWVYYWPGSKHMYLFDKSSFIYWYYH